MSAPRSDLPLNRDEWPNLSTIGGDGRARFADGELVTPLAPLEPQAPPSTGRLLVVLVLCVALACFFAAMAR